MQRPKNLLQRHFSVSPIPKNLVQRHSSVSPIPRNLLQRRSPGLPHHSNDGELDASDDLIPGNLLQRLGDESLRVSPGLFLRRRERETTRERPTRVAVPGLPAWGGLALLPGTLLLLAHCSSGGSGGPSPTDGGHDASGTPHPDGGAKTDGAHEAASAEAGDGSAVASATLSVTPSFVVTGAGQTATLAWSSAHASTCTGTGFSTGGATSGTATVDPSDTAGTSTYSVECDGVRRSATVTTKAFDPTTPTEFGYALVFGGPFALSGIDCDNTLAPGFDWYVTNWWGGVQSCSGMSVDSSGGLSVTSKPVTDDIGYAVLQTNTKNKAGKDWVGTDFAGGWYFETSFSVAAPATSGYATFWAPDTDFEFPGEQWPGQATGYRHGLENDMLDCIAACGAPSNTLEAGERDWFGVYGAGEAQCDFPSSGIPANSGYATGAFCYQNSGGNALTITDAWSSFHTGGELWLPGNANNGMNGQFQHYLYDTGSAPVLVKTDTYTDPPPTSPPPGGSTGKGPGILAIGDQQHFGLIIGAPASTPLLVQWLRVWQLPSGTKRVQ
jgi:hypothetical protein